MDYKIFVAERIAQLRQAKGTSARDMSLCMGQNVNYINQIENCKTEPSLSLLFYICEYFGLTPQEFFDVENPHPTRLNDLMESAKQLNENELLHLSDFIKEVVSKRK